jgi:general secretion pathway protein L
MAISVNSASALVSDFFSWWLGELQALWVPVRRVLRRGPKIVTLNTSDQQWVLRLEKGSRFQELGRVDSLTEVNASRKKLGALIRKAKLGDFSLVVLLPEIKSLRRRLDLPAISDHDLRQALFFEIERQTPFRPEDVYFDYRVAARRPESKRLTVELVIAPRATVDPILSQVKGLGLQLSGVDVVARNSHSRLGVNLLRTGQATASWSSLHLALALLLIGLLGAVLYVPVSQLASEDDSIAAQVAEESGKAKQTTKKRAELDEIVKAAAFLDERKKNAPSILGMIDELTKALPDNTWLISLTQTNTEVKISGYSAAAAELIPLIDNVPLFKNPTFSSPIVQDPQKKLERFDISMEINTKGAKP